MRTSRMTLGIGVALMLSLATGCSGDDQTHDTTTQPPALTEPLQLAGGTTGLDVLDFVAVPGRAMVVFTTRVCDDADCATTTTHLMAADQTGEQWTIEDFADTIGFEIDADGANVLVNTADGVSTSYPLDGPQPIAISDDLPTPTADEIPGFSLHNDVAAVLSDGRYLIRGSWDQDAPMASRWQQRDAEEASDEPRRPIRLFLYDPADGTLAPVSGIPESHEVTTAMGTSFGPDTVLGVSVLAGEQIVAYTVGFNGAAYDLAFSFYLAPIPAK